MTTVIYGKKIEMGEAFIGETRHGVTKIELYSMTVSQAKSESTDGYAALQVGFASPKKHARSHHKFGKTREIAFEENLTVGTVISPKEIVKVGDLCLIQGVSKGKGFAGVVKRYGFAGGPRTHGQSDRLRAPGSIGQGTTPGRVHKGKKMPGRMGTDTVTVKNAQVVSFDETTNIIWVTGGVPGHRHSLVRLTVAGHKDMGTLSYLSGVKLTKEVIIEPEAQA